MPFCRAAKRRGAAQRRKRQTAGCDGGDAARLADDGREHLVGPRRQARPFQTDEDDDRFGQRAEAHGQKGRIGGTVPELRAPAEPVGRHLLDDELPRHALGQPQDGEQDEAQREGQSGGALGEASERDERGDDPPQRLDVPSFSTHHRASFDLVHSRAGV